LKKKTRNREGAKLEKRLHQAEIFQKAIDNNRKMKQITAEMRRISLEILNLTTQGVNKRKPGERD
jgi:hypothetical protein